MSDISFTDYINDSIRILVLCDTLKIKPKLKITENRIKLYDYYLRFPNTMFENAEVVSSNKKNFDEYYSFYHWQPDVIRYRRNINYLISKGLIEKNFDENQIYYTISEDGVSALSMIKHSYKNRVALSANMLLKNIVKLSDKKVEEDIKRKSDICSRTLGEM